MKRSVKRASLERPLTPILPAKDIAAVSIILCSTIVCAYSIKRDRRLRGSRLV